MNSTLVIGLDSSTQSTKAIAWTRDGAAAGEGRAPVSMSSPASGWAEQDPEEWWTAARAALRDLVQDVDVSQCAGLAISNQRETVAFLDPGLRPVRPAIVWLDERSRDRIAPLTAAIGADVLHRISGKPPDITPTIYRLDWLRANEPETLDGTAHVLDAHGYLTGRLTGTPWASSTSADPFGIFDINEGAWSQPLLDHLGISLRQLPRVAPPGSEIGTVSEEAAAATGLPAGLPVYAGGGDGQCAGLGVNAVAPGKVYLNLGTALITGAWSPDPRLSKAWRTMTSPTGDGYFLEGGQRAGAYLVNWFVDTYAGGRDDTAVFDRLEAQAAALPVGAEGVLFSPHLSGCMDPHWDPDARASFVGLGPHHSIGHLYRAMLEAMTLESARCIAAMRAEGLGPERLLAVGGGAASALWTRMFVDAAGLPLTRSESLEASALGAGMSAAVGAGWYPDFATAAAAMSREGETIQPDPATAEAWRQLSERQAQAYRPTH